MCSLVVAWMGGRDGEMARVRSGGTCARCGTAAANADAQYFGALSVRSTRVSPRSARGWRGRPRRAVRRAGLQGVTGGTLETSVDYADFDDYWEPFTGGGGPASGAFYASLDDAGKATLRDTVRASLPEGPFTLPARAWLALGEPFRAMA